MFPWLTSKGSIDKRTFKLEVMYRNELILLRFIHLDKFYPLEYCRVACQLANSIIQNNLIRIEQQEIKQK